MTGLPEGVTVEVEFISGAWIDVTAYVAAEDKVSGRFGRSTEFGDVNASTLTLAFRNDDGRFTPDSAGSPYYPYITEGRRLRVTVTQAAVDYPLFTGTILSWEPSFGALVTDSTVTVTANDSLALLALHTFDSRWVEQARALARTAGTWVDIYAPAGDATTRAWNNIGFTTTGGTLGTVAIVPATSGAGELSYGKPDSLVIDTSVEFKPVAGVGMVANVVPGGSSPSAVSFWLRVATGTLPGSNRYVLLLRGSGVNLGSLRLVNSGGSCNLVVESAAGAILSTLVTGVADDKWRLVALTKSGSSTLWTVTTAAGATTYTAAFNMTTATAFYLGGESVGGLAIDAADGISIAGMSVAGDATVVPAVTDALAAQTYNHTDLFTTLQSFVPEVTDWATAGTDVLTVGEPAWAGSTALTVLQALARTITGVAYVDGSGTVTLAANDVVRPAIAATLDIGEDLAVDAALPTLRRAADSRPTRIKVDYAGGSTTLIDTDAETDGRPRREQSLATYAADAAGAQLAGQYLLDTVNGLRITQVAVDLTTSVQDLWAVFLTLFPTQSFALDGWDAALIGATTLTVYAQGWQLAIDHQSVVYTLDCSPGGEFVGAVWDAGDEFGRWSGYGTMTVTSGTAIGTTSNGTLVITTSGGNPTLSTSAGDYPMYLDWDGEKVQVTSPPAGSSSPQTVTTTARGVVPSVARSNHIAGESVDVWHCATWQ